MATALRNLGLLENIKGNYSEARSFLEQSLDIWRELGSAGKMGKAWTLIFLGDAALNHDEPEWARSLYEESSAILREHGDMNFLAYSVRRLGQLAWREGDYEQATILCKESLILNQKVNDPRGTIATLSGFAAIAVVQERFPRAAKLMAAVETQISSTDIRHYEGDGSQQQFLAVDAIGIRLLYVDKLEYERNLAFLRTQLDEKNFNKFWAKGKAMSLDEAIAFALDEK
jgi:tetratricopeptide (TPR) repeat protein